MNCAIALAPCCIVVRYGEWTVRSRSGLSIARLGFEMNL